MTQRAGLISNMTWLGGAQVLARLLQLAAYASLARAGSARSALVASSTRFSTGHGRLLLATLGLPILYTRHIAADRTGPCACSDADEAPAHPRRRAVRFAVVVADPPSIAVDLLAMMFAAMLLRGYHHFGASGLRGRERMEGEALATVAGRLVFTIAAGGGVWLVDEPAAMLRVTFMGFLAGEMITLIMVTRSMRALGLVWDPPLPTPHQRAEVWRELLPFAAAGLLGLIAFRVDVVMLRSLSTPLMADHLVGSYGAAYRILGGGSLRPRRDRRRFVPGAGSNPDERRAPERSFSPSDARARRTWARGRCGAVLRCATPHACLRRSRV